MNSNYYKYYVRDNDNHILACVGIYVDKSSWTKNNKRFTYHRLISLPNPKEKLRKKELAEYNEKTLLDLVKMGSENVKFPYFGGVRDSIDNLRFYWTLRYGEFPDDGYNFKYQKCVALYNHEYRMINPPIDSFPIDSN